MRHVDTGSVMDESKCVIETDIPARLDRLPWSRFHWLVVTALGVTWVLDGLEVTLVGSLSPALTDRQSLGLSATEVGFAASAYLVGAILGAIGFGYLTDRYGRKRLFVITVAVYATATAATGLSWNFASFALFRLLTGAGIGGEYSAINSAIQELVPARRRGWTDLFVNCTFWAGAMLGALATSLALDPALVPLAIGWRFAFVVGGVVAVVAIVLRGYVPESPRWLMTHGRLPEAERVVSEIERRVVKEVDRPTFARPSARVRLRSHHSRGLRDVGRILLRRYPRRAVVCLVLMAAQAFLYNAIFFTYGLVLSRFYGVPDRTIGTYVIVFAFANLLGPVVLGPLFDSLGRKTMIAATYGAAAMAMAVTAVLFDLGRLTAVTQTASWMAVFFPASAAASAAYLTVGESFPLELRALIIALFYALGTGVGGIAGPAVMSLLIETGLPRNIMLGYLAGAGFMLAAAVVEACFGISAERRSLEDVTSPLALIEAAPDSADAGTGRSGEGKDGARSRWG